VRRGVRLLAATVLFLGGCIIVPTPPHTPTNSPCRSGIADEDLAALDTGTSRADALLRLGEPDFVEDGGRRMTYVWAVATADVEFLGGGNGEVSTIHSLTLDFGEGGRLVQKRLGKLP
jgi:outer membrane protein assembly factor BamE (lipoprotein component of BamABCDE complex)